jgi:hypothetical protein
MIQYLAGNSNISYGIDSLSLRLFGPGAKSEDSSCYTIATSSASDDSLSLLYTALPQALQSRVPKLRSLRSVASVYTSRKPQAYTAHSPVSSASSSYSESPPPSYHARTSTSDDDDEDDEDDNDDDDDGNSDAGSPSSFNTAPSSRPSTSGSATPAPNFSTFLATQDHHQHPSTNPTGITNKSGHHGLALLNLALRSSESNSSTPNDPVDRRFYIDGVSYILRGLPKDLTAEETLVLRTATPQTLLPPSPPPASESQTITSSSTPPTSSAPTLLHTLTATLTYHLLLLTTLLLPHLQTLLTTLIALDAQHRLSARFYSQTKNLLNNLVLRSR